MLQSVLNQNICYNLS